ncbi:MAG TPA: DUF2157 domain-containing protein [Terracidiphilus sp.]|jgi:uncharacterized membrane protein|nr:DUF2157 domain-containing protein [Terracidiphilus sp.]
MANIESLLNRWQNAGVVDAEVASRIRVFESERNSAPAQSSTRLGWQGTVALVLGAILLACGVVLLVSAHWDEISPGARYALVMAMVAVFHLGGAATREGYRGLSTTLHAVGTISTGAAIALVGQIFNIQEHWPAAVLLWAVAALAGWALLRDEAQETLTLLLFPAWIVSEFSFAAEGHIGQDVYLGRFLLVWAALYLTVFLGSKHKIVQGILFAAAAISAVVAVLLMVESWRSWNGQQTFLPFHTRVWGWIEIALLPLIASLVRFRKSLFPVVIAIILGAALPWCNHTWMEHYQYSNGALGSYTQSEPNVFAHALVAGFCVFLIWWGVQMSSKALVNFGIVGFAVTVIWFYFSNIFDKVGRSLGLIGMGILFLAGGWALERMRRRLLTRMALTHFSREEAQ